MATGQRLRVRSFWRVASFVLGGAAFATVLYLAVMPIASAQDISPETLRLLQQRQNGAEQVEDPNSTVKPRVDVYPPIVIPKDDTILTRLEDIYTNRSGVNLRLFGYDVVGLPSQVMIAQAGAVPDGYVLGHDDELLVTLRGQESATYRVRVDRDGRVTLPKLSPILAAGRRFGDFRAELETLVSQAYLSTKVFVTLGNIHQLSILVSGEVRVPGVRIVNALASPLDAILLSGGIKKSGSLRNIRVVNGGVSRIVDLYSVIAQGQTGGLGNLRDGDRIYVPPLGATVAISGPVARSAIYELPAGSSAISANSLLHLAGGVQIAGSYNLSKLGLGRDNSLALVPVGQNSPVRSGELLIVTQGHGGLIGRVLIVGASPSVGFRPLSINPTVGATFRSAADLGTAAYAAFALIKRRDLVSNANTLIPVSLVAAIRGTRDVTLQGEDAVVVLTRREAEALANTVTRDLNSAYTPKPSIGTGAGSALQDTQTPANAPPQQFNPAAALSGPSGPPISTTTAVNPSMPNPGLQQAPLAQPNEDLRFRASGQNDSSESAALGEAQALLQRNARTNRSDETDEQVIADLASVLGVSADALLRLASDNLVWVLDEVRQPGPYLAAGGTSIADLIQSAGGVQLTADLSEIEVTSTVIDQGNGTSRTARSSYDQRDGKLQLVSINAGDVIRLRPVYSDREEGTVTVAGEVRYPGVFDITRDERLSSLLQRAGGMSEVAYPYGAIFTRKEAALSEKDGNERSAHELESEIPALLASQSGQGGSNANAGTYLTALVQSLRNMPALGRIVVTADPAVLATKPELDFVLQPGDTLYIPKRPSTVTVSGEILHSGSFQYRAGLTYSDYLRMAGGATQSADEGRTFIIFPDGSASTIDSQWLSFGGGGSIPPGATIIVPRDLRPFNWSQFLKDATQIVSQLAVTAASLSVLRSN